jgi:hypothetical protein
MSRAPDFRICVSIEISLFSLNIVLSMTVLRNRIKSRVKGSSCPEGELQAMTNWEHRLNPFSKSSSYSSSSILVLGLAACYGLQLPFFGLPGSRPAGHIETFVLESWHCPLFLHVVTSFVRSC